MALFTNLKINLTFFYNIVTISYFTHADNSTKLLLQHTPCISMIFIQTDKSMPTCYTNDIEFKNKIAAMNDYHSSWD